MTMLCTLIRGQMSYTFFQLGAHVLLCQLLGGQMSSYAFFHRGGGGAHVRGGGECPTLTYKTLLLLEHVEKNVLPMVSFSCF